MNKPQSQISTQYISLMFVLLLAAYLFVGFGVPALRLGRYPLEVRQQVYAEAVEDLCALPPDFDYLGTGARVGGERDEWLREFGVHRVDLPRIITQGYRRAWADADCVGETLDYFDQLLEGTYELNLAEAYGFPEDIARLLIDEYRSSH